MSDVTGSVDFATSDPFNSDTAGTTPKAFTVNKDARSEQGGGTYPNYWSHKTRSGHSFIMDDTPGNETVTLQHRSGSAIQMKPDGGVTMTTHNGKYEVVFGEDRVTVSGAQDITVKGDASFRVYGDYNVTVHKDYNLTVLGNMNMTAKNLNRSIRGTMDTEAKTVNKRVEGSLTYNSQGAQTYLASGDTALASTGKGKVQVVAASGDLGVHALGKSSKFVMAGAGDMYQNSGKTFNGTYYSLSTVGGPHHKYGVGTPGSLYQKKVLVDAAGLHTMVAHDEMRKVQGSVNKMIGMNETKDITGQKSTKAGAGISHTATSGHIIHTAQTGSISHTATTGSVEIRAPAGATNIAGGTLNINALSGLLGMAGSAGVALDSLGSLLNLNGGIATIMSALGISLPFNITEASQAQTPPTLQGTQANQPTQEPDASSEINSWL